MSSYSCKNVNLYDADSDDESGSSYDVVDHPGTPTSSRGEVKEKITSELAKQEVEYFSAEKVQDSCPAPEEKFEVSFAAKLQEDEKEKSML